MTSHLIAFVLGVASCFAGMWLMVVLCMSAVDQADDEEMADREHEARR